jgi:hypothetical protein
MAHNLSGITYLQTGTPRQRSAYAVLAAVMADLADYQPILTGTIPLDIDIPDSDLDVICYADDLKRFFERVKIKYSHDDCFQIAQYPINGVDSVVANFWRDGFQIEIFAQPIPVFEQNAYRHMVVEARLLQIGGDDAKHTIRALKASGMKTEPAFAQYFGLDGDPYQTLLALYGLSDDELIERMKK